MAGVGVPWLSVDTGSVSTLLLHRGFRRHEGSSPLSPYLTRGNGAQLTGVQSDRPIGAEVSVPPNIQEQGVSPSVHCRQNTLSALPQAGATPIMTHGPWLLLSPVWTTGALTNHTCLSCHEPASAEGLGVLRTPC